MTHTVKLSETFMEAVGPELAARTDWESRLRRSSLSSFGSADGSFGDVISVTMNGSFDSLGFTTLLWSYGMLLNDKKTPPEVVAKLLKPLTAAFVRALESTPLEQQDKGDLVNFMDSFNKARVSGRFDEEGVAEIGRVMRAMAKNFSAKIAAEQNEKTLAATLTGLAEGITHNIAVRSLKLKKA